MTVPRIIVGGLLLIGAGLNLWLAARSLSLAHFLHRWTFRSVHIQTAMKTLAYAAGCGVWTWLLHWGGFW